LFRFSGKSRVSGVGSGFAQINRGKRSIAIDLKSKATREILDRLIKSADILIHNIRLGAAKRLGIDAPSCFALNPRLIHAHIVGYDSDGPYGERAAFEDLIQTTSGATSLIKLANPDAEPRFLPTLIADKVSACFATSSILAALFARERSEKGLAIEVPMLECLTSFLLVENLGGMRWSSQPEDAGYERMRKPALRPFRTADGFIGILPYSDKHWQAILNVLGLEDLIIDARLATHNARVENLDWLYGLIHQRTPMQTSCYWLQVLGDADIPCSPYNDIGTVIKDEHLEAIGFFVSRDDPAEGSILATRAPVKYNGQAPATNVSAPRLGEATEFILSKLGFDENAISSFFSAGIVK
jgi:crotonobetainyl-CoA:carnitine CoA-transferase CaiB-like acyl-CoA transferase